jgi:dolichol-phosphate mannosyltransferase
MQLMKKACIILPTRNEALNIPILIPDIFAQSEVITSHELHVLVVDDSVDGTPETVRDLQKQYSNLYLLEEPKKGLGEAYRRGFSHALQDLEADLVFQMDADLQNDPNLLPEFIRCAQQGYSLIIGSRFIPGGSTPGYTLFRRYQSLWGSKFIRNFSQIRGVIDCTSGYRCIGGEVLKRCELGSLGSDGFTFQTQLLCELILKGARVKEVPIVFRKREHGRSKLTLKDRVEFLLSLINMFSRRIR